MINSIDSKLCNKCQEVKSLTSFSTRSNGVQSHCKLCAANKSRDWYERNRAKKIESSKVWGENNKSKKLEHGRVWQENNKAKISTRHKKWYENNKHDRCKYNSLYRKSNPDKGRFYTSTRRAIKLNAEPQWRTQIDRDRQANIYKQCIEFEKTTGLKHHLDHIHPLNSNLICGLELSINMRAILAVDNLSKNNSFVPFVESTGFISTSELRELKIMVTKFKNMAC